MSSEFTSRDQVRAKFKADIKNKICPDCGNPIEEVEGCLICNKCDWGQVKDN